MEQKVLVACFSASGVTKKVGEAIARVAGGDFFEIVPKVRYTTQDLDWTNRSSRSSVEMREPNSRPEIANALPDVASYTTVIMGFIIETFLESCDFNGQTILPFCTSGGSGVGASDSALHKNVRGSVKWGKGVQINHPDEAEIRNWLERAL